jgi:large subunit ribosomal protein L30
MSAESKTKKIKVQYYHSCLGYNKKQRATLRGLGFRKLNQIIEREATPQVMGMIKKIPHLVRVIQED